MSCYIDTVVLHATIDGENYGKTECRIIDYVNGTWSLQFGEFAGRYEVRATTQDLEALFLKLGAALNRNEQEMAVLSGDFENYGETEPKWDEKQTEGWLDVEG